MPKPKKTGYLEAAKENLNLHEGISAAQAGHRIAAAQALATVALAEQQTRTADALETRNLIALLDLKARSQQPNAGLNTLVHDRLGLGHE